MLELLIGLLVGSVLALTGSGGSLFSVPLILFLLQYSPNHAIGLSLGLVAVSSFIGALCHMHARNIAWSQATLFCLVGVVAAPLGRHIGTALGDLIVIVGFSLLSLYLAVTMWQASKETTAVRQSCASTASIAGLELQPELELKLVSGEQEVADGLPKLLGLARISMLAVIGGLLSGIFGVGGGFIFVPLLHKYCGVSFHTALGTSLLIVAFNSLSGFITHLSLYGFDVFQRLEIMCLGGAIGMIIATRYAFLFSKTIIQKVFSVSIAVAAFYMLFKFSYEVFNVQPAG